MKNQQIDAKIIQISPERCESFGLSGTDVSDGRCEPAMGEIQPFLQHPLQGRNVIFDANQYGHPWHHRDAPKGHLLR